MEMKQINKVSIALKPNVYSTFRNLNNTVSNTLGEYVDNAVQSFLNHKTELFDLESNYKLRIEISVDWENRTILISDNAAGIDAVNYQRAFEPAHIPLDDTGLNEFGMGMKTASVWLANKWCVYTKALGEDVERFTEFDLQKVTTEEKEELVVIEKNAPANEHYTRIILSQLSTNAPKPGQMEKIRRHLSSIYRQFLRTGNVEIIVNGQSLEAPDYGILYAPFYKTPDGENILWRKEIDFEMGEYKAKGFIAILDKIQNGANGLVLMRRGRVIVGGGDERYFPTVIFGQSGSFRYRRLFGEIELEGFEVSFNKNGFREEEDLYLFMDALKDELKADNLNILGQTDNYRQRGKDQYTKISKAIKKDLEKKAKPKQLSRQVSEVEAKISNQQYLQKNEDVIIRIYYYLCASHAHLGDEAFFELRDKLNEYEKVFLHGIYYRKRKRYDKAEAKFREALNIYPNSYTAKNELAIALQRQGRYLDALHIAKEAYNAQPNNAFYIVTYFKSLVRDIKTEEYVLKELIDRLRSAWDTNREIFSLMLEAEYEYYRNNDFNAAMTLFKRALEINNFQPIFISASEICSIENRFDVYEDLAKKYHYND